MKVESTSQDDKEIFMLLNQEIITTEKYLQYEISEFLKN